VTKIATAARFFLPMILQNGDSRDMDSEDVTSSSQYDTGTNDDNDSGAVSSDSSTPLMELKRAKMRRQKEMEERAKKKQKTQQSPKAKQKGRQKSPTKTTTTSKKTAGKNAASKKAATKKTTTKTNASQKTTKAKTPTKPKTPTTKTKPKVSPKPTKKTKASPKPKLSSAKKDTKTKTVAKPETTKKKPVEDLPKEKSNTTDDSTSMHSSDSEEEEEAACCMCHCGVDCSDRALFFAKDRKQELEEDEDYYFGLKDPYLDGERFYDRNNALVYCDTCNRLYHQKCHFVPLLVVPRGEFHCLICTIQQQKQKQTSPTTKKRKSPIKAAPEPPIPNKFLKRKITDQLFQSPPTPSTEILDIKKLQHEWEVATGHAKAKLWNQQFKQLRTFLKSQASNIRMANTTLATMTSTKRNRQHFLQTKVGTKSSQELAQTLCKLTGAKFKIREALLSLEVLRVNNEAIDFAGLNAWCEEHPKHANHVFPFGSDHCRKGRRIVPRTRERKQDEKKTDAIPTEITLCDSKESKSTFKSKKGETRNAKSEKKASEDDDDDSGITLDDLQCAVCMIGDATDENDVLLCDGKDCHRAFHMKCVYPHVTPEEIENEDEDWFCPICSQSTELMGEIHDLCVADENEEASIESWDDVHEDVFPGSQWEYETAQKILKGKRNEDTQRLLTMFLGEDIHKKKVQMPVGSDSEDENDYSLFDEDSFHERRQKEKDDQSFGDSVASSEATLLDYDDIDYKVKKSELDALSEEEGSESESEEDEDDDDDDDDSENRVRRSRRLEKKEEEDEAKPMDMGADFDEANIIVGKRKRKRVNYRKLNDMMFGDLSDQQQGMIDGGDDFDAPKPAKAESDNESGGEESGEDGSENGSDDGSGSGSEDGSDKESNEGSDDGSEDETGDGSDDESDSN